MLKNYLVKGMQFQFEEGEQPAGAVELTAVKPPEAKKAETENKAVKPANKGRKVADK